MNLLNIEIPLVCLNMIALYLSNAALRMAELPPMPATARDRSGSTESVRLPEVNSEGRGQR